MSEARLIRQLTAEYDKDARPVRNASHVVEIYSQFVLGHIEALVGCFWTCSQGNVSWVLLMSTSEDVYTLYRSLYRFLPLVGCLAFWTHAPGRVTW